MDGRTRVKNTIERRDVDRIPRYDSFWEDTLTEWQGQGMPEEVDPLEFFDWDICTMSVDTSMRCEQSIVSQDDPYVTYRDRFGYTVRKTIGKSRSLEFSDHVTADRETWNALRGRFDFDPTDRSRLDTKSYFMHMDEYPTWSEAKRQYDGLRETGRFISFVAYGPWEGTWRHRGFTQLLMDSAEDPAWVREMGEIQTELLIACLQHSIDLGMRPDGLFLVDDLAYTKGLLFAPDAWRRIFRPAYRRLGTFLQANDISFWLHCCGDCGVLIRDFIECGVDVLQPLQASAGMDLRELKPTYGADLTFWGNIAVPRMSGPAEACEEEIREKILCGKEGGGYMYHSDHSVPPEVTFDRYRWIMDLVHEYGTY